MDEEMQKIRVIEGAWSIKDVIREVVEDGTQEHPFCVMDVGEVVARYRHWKELMPRVVPFYAVKCNDDKVLIQTLAAFGTGFDCASRAEIELVTSLGVSSERIIFAHPTKMPSHIRYASEVGVHTMTFDSDVELLKVKQDMPNAQLVVRIRCDAAVALFCLGNKFGCDPVAEAPILLKKAADLGLQVVGVSFHVGSGAAEPEVYARGLKHCRDLFRIGTALGHQMNLVDIGGGFLGEKNSSITEEAKVINAALEEYFPSSNVRVISEPGRYFATAAYTMATMVFATKDIPCKERDGEMHRMCIMNDGSFGSFSCVLFGPVTFDVEPLNPSPGPLMECSLWGPAAGPDSITTNKYFPPLSEGDWVVFQDMGAYSIILGSRFNGFWQPPAVKHVVDVSIWSELRELMPSSMFTEHTTVSESVSRTSAYETGSSSDSDSSASETRSSASEKGSSVDISSVPETLACEVPSTASLSINC